MPLYIKNENEVRNEDNTPLQANTPSTGSLYSTSNVTNCGQRALQLIERHKQERQQARSKRAGQGILKTLEKNRTPNCNSVHRNVVNRKDSKTKDDQNNLPVPSRGTVSAYEKSKIVQLMIQNGVLSTDKSKSGQQDRHLVKVSQASASNAAKLQALQDTESVEYLNFSVDANDNEGANILNRRNRTRSYLQNYVKSRERELTGASNCDPIPATYLEEFGYKQKGDQPSATGISAISTSDSTNHVQFQLPISNRTHWEQYGESMDIDGNPNTNKNDKAQPLIKPTPTRKTQKANATTHQPHIPKREVSQRAIKNENTAPPLVPATTRAPSTTPSRSASTTSSKKKRDNWLRMLVIGGLILILFLIIMVVLIMRKKPKTATSVNQSDAYPQHYGPIM